MPLKCMIHLLYGKERSGERARQREREKEREQVESERRSVAGKELRLGS